MKCKSPPGNLLNVSWRSVKLSLSSKTKVGKKYRSQIFCYFSVDAATISGSFQEKSTDIKTEQQFSYQIINDIPDPKKVRIIIQEIYSRSKHNAIDAY